MAVRKKSCGHYILDKGFANVLLKHRKGKSRSADMKKSDTDSISLVNRFAPLTSVVDTTLETSEIPSHDVDKNFHLKNHYKKSKVQVCKVQDTNEYKVCDKVDDSQNTFPHNIALFAVKIGERFLVEI